MIRAIAPVDIATLTPPNVPVKTPKDAPVKVIHGRDLKRVGDKFNDLFTQYKSDRRLAELRWLRNQRQYLGLYDPEIDKEMSPNRSRAYPRITRVKCISVLSRLMNLMFQGTEENWTIAPSPVPNFKVADVEEAITSAQQEDQAAGVQSPLSIEYVNTAMQRLARKRADELIDTIKDQLQEIGGNQSSDYVALNRKAVQSGIIYGVGVLRGPYAVSFKQVDVSLEPMTNKPVVTERTRYKPLFEFLPVWDFYPDMSAKTLEGMDGYFTRTAMSKAQVRALADREDFFADQIKDYLRTNTVGNYRPTEYETELRTMGVRTNVNEMKIETMKYEIVTWHGMVSGDFLRMCGVDVDDDKLTDDLEAEIWMIAGNVIKADLNTWRKLDMQVKTLQKFLFDEDDTSPLGQGLPNIVRDSQMAISAATRMLLDNASVICGPNLELNTDLLRGDQDLASTTAYKMWYREGTGPDAQFPAVRNVEINGHLDELLKVIELFMKFADQETFVGPATGGDMAQSPSEPMRTAAGASMLRGDAALPFKDIVRQFDRLTQSLIQSLVCFNRAFNPDKAHEGDYNIIARGATSLIAKEVRGMQVDQLAQTLTPEEKDHVDMRALVRQRMLTRDLADLLLPEDEVARNQAQRSQQQDQQQQLATAAQQAQTRKLLADAYKNIAAGNKNNVAADAHQIETALNLMVQGVQGGGQAQQGAVDGAAGPDQQPQGDAGPLGPDPTAQLPAGQVQG